MLIEDLEEYEDLAGDDLEEIPLIEDIDEKEDNVKKDGLDGIHLELEGVSIEEELIYLRDKCEQTPNANTFPLYICFGTEKRFAGHLNLDLNTIMELRYLGNTNYELNLVNGNNSVAILTKKSERSDVSRLLNFIRVRG